MAESTRPYEELERGLAELRGRLMEHEKTLTLIDALSDQMTEMLYRQPFKMPVVFLHWCCMGLVVQLPTYWDIWRFNRRIALVSRLIDRLRAIDDELLNLRLSREDNI